MCKYFLIRWNLKIFKCIIHVSYVNYKKAFDHVDWTSLMTIIQNIGVGWSQKIDL